MDAKEEKLVPNIRFRGFTHAWEQRKLGEIARISTGSSNQQDAVNDGKYPFFVRSENIERSNRYTFDGEAILIPGEGKLGDIYHYVNGKFDYHQRVYKISNFSDCRGKFILYCMKKNFKRHALKYTVKATVDSLRLPILTNFNVLIPNISEQVILSQFFSNIDHLLTLHERKLELLKELKKAFSQLMFPDKDETVPKLRFKGFDGEWKQRKLDEISKIVMTEFTKLQIIKIQV
ncbi:restriction endonuclease subunit S [Bombilactobacillus thymidiniphilus]|uniref:Restriction endonuclease subunit S n=1 Tax=Bombilactobacillus thymidiniphilus TaxID=2923363 RepID=A0ABY4PEA9_9LACO|nr:restriction endonuclease subunit S [Bombilactobacillus thymidiniphilus]UQS84123.1 restriction endonuclease subunit S [Bombilactobacillus thymidiniphilus]